MKRIIVLAVALAVAPLAGAALYKYVDKDGKTAYSDQPPPNVQSEELHVAPQPDGPPSKSYVEQDKELEKVRAAERAKEKKAQQAAANAKLAEQRCAQAREYYRAYAQGGRLLRYDDKGERQYLTDEEIEAGRVKSKKQMEEACKKS